MKSLRESLFDRDIATNMKSSSLLDLVKGHVDEVRLPYGFHLSNTFREEEISKMIKDYGEHVLPTKRYASKYYKIAFGAVNPFLNYLLSKVIVTNLKNIQAESRWIEDPLLEDVLNKISKYKMCVKRLIWNDNISFAFYWKDDNFRLKSSVVNIYFDKGVGELLNKVNESLFDRDLATSEIMYHPKTKNELIACIEEQLDIQGPDADLNIIDVSKITDMSELFFDFKHEIGNIDISTWDVRNVVNMAYMFDGCYKFNSDLSKWDVRNVVNTKRMFCNCHKFNSDLSKWDVRNVVNMREMFEVCKSFNSDLSKWDVRNVVYMEWMFNNCHKFNSDLSKWDVRNVENMGRMFDECHKFNSDLSKWDVRNVKNMAHMFDGCTSLKKIPDWYKYKN